MFKRIRGVVITGYCLIFLFVLSGKVYFFNITHFGMSFTKSYRSWSKIFFCGTNLNGEPKTRQKSLKVFRLKASILGLKFVNLVMFNCSLLSKTCLNVYRPTSPILSLPGTSCKLLSSAPAVPQWCHSGAPVVPPVSSGLPPLVTPF